MMVLMVVLLMLLNSICGVFYIICCGMIIWLLMVNSVVSCVLMWVFRYCVRLLVNVVVLVGVSGLIRIFSLLL